MLLSFIVYLLKPNTFVGIFVFKNNLFKFKFKQTNKLFCTVPCATFLLNLNINRKRIKLGSININKYKPSLEFIFKWLTHK